MVVGGGGGGGMGGRGACGGSLNSRLIQSPILGCGGVALFSRNCLKKTWIVTAYLLGRIRKLFQNVVC